MTDMSPSRSYLFKGLYDWVLDNNDIPYVVVDANYPQTSLPLEYVNEGTMTLNIHHSAVANFYMDHQCVSFDARFGGKSMAIYIPIMAIKAIFAKHSGQGMVFGAEPGAEQHKQPDSLNNQSEAKSAQPSHLKLVK